MEKQLLGPDLHLAGVGNLYSEKNRLMDRLFVPDLGNYIQVTE